MDEARRVLDRLERIEKLRAGESGPRELLDELRGLLRDGEAWLAVEGPAQTQGAERAIAALGTAVATGEAVVHENEETW